MKNTKFLGVIINENLTWTDHINVINNKCNKSIGILRKLHNTLPKSTLVTLYNTLVYPYLNYCNIAWASQPNETINKLFRTQKRLYVLLQTPLGTPILYLYLNN